MHLSWAARTISERCCLMGRRRRRRLCDRSTRVDPRVTLLLGVRVERGHRQRDRVRRSTDQT